VLSEISGMLGSHGISIESMIQRAPFRQKSQTALILTTHAAKEGDLVNAVEAIDRLVRVESPTFRMRVRD
jgi:homoserine dehydrogenase